jgi:hypothetical protein
VIGLAYRSKGRPFAVSISLAVFGALIVFLVAANLTTAQDWQVYITATIAMTIVGGISFLVLWRAGKGGDASFLALVALLLAFVVFSKASIAAGNVYFDQFCKPNPIYKICDGNSNYQHQLGDDTTGLVSLVELAEYYSGQRCAGMNNEVNVAVWGTRRQYESSTYHEDGNFVFDKPLDDGTASFRARDNAAEALHMGAVGTKVTVACVD